MISSGAGNSSWLKRAFSFSLFLLLSAVLVFSGFVLSGGQAQAAPAYSPFPTSMTATVGVNFSYPFQITGTPYCSSPTYHWELWNTAPSWLGITPTGNPGIVSGIPTTAGTYVFQVRCYETNTSGCGPSYVTGTGFNVNKWTPVITLTVLPAPTITYAGYPLSMTAYVGQLFSYQFLLTGTPYCSSPIYKWELWNTAPPWLSIDNTGTVSGYPTTPGTAVFQVRGHDEGTGSCTCPCYIRDGQTNINKWTPVITITILPPGGGSPPPSSSGTYNFTVKIGPGLSSGTTKVLIDGVNKGNPTGGESKTFTALQGSSHVVTVDQVVASNSQPGIRFAVDGTNTKTAGEDNLLIYFDYRATAVINVTTDPPHITNDPLLQRSLDYALDSVFQSTAPGTVDPTSNTGTKYQFKQWSLPDGTSSPGKALTYTISAPGTFTAVYDAYYLLTLSSDNPTFNESAWYKSGTNVNYSFAISEAPMPGFCGFLGGKVKAVNPTGTHLMDGPYTQKITWNNDYTIPLIIILVILLVIGGLIFFAFRRTWSKGTRAAIPVVDPLTRQATAAPLDATRVITVRSAAKEENSTSEKEHAESNFCPKCGSTVDKDASFCKKCGAKVG